MAGFLVRYTVSTFRSLVIPSCAECGGRVRYDILRRRRGYAEGHRCGVRAVLRLQPLAPGCLPGRAQDGGGDCRNVPQDVQ